LIQKPRLENARPPAGQEEFFMAVGFPVESRSSTPPRPNAEELAEKRRLMASLLRKYRTEMLG
jgi:hypothetical protein